MIVKQRDDLLFRAFLIVLSALPLSLAMIPKRVTSSTSADSMVTLDASYGPIS